MIWGYLHFRKPPFFPLHRHFMEPIAPRKTATVRRLLASAGIRAWRAQVEPRLGNGNHTTYKNGESLGCDLWHCFYQHYLEKDCDFV